MTVMDLASLFTSENLIAFLTLTMMEVILGIDNVVFIAILAGRLPPEQRDKARTLGLSFAVISRICLLAGISWVISLKNPLIDLHSLGFEHAMSGKDLIMLGGGLFLIYKATHEIYMKVEGHEEHGEHGGATKTYPSLTSMLIQVIIIDVVFSLDSVITAVGMCKSIPVMIAAILASVAIMLWFSKAVVTFIDKHPTIKILALSFLLLIGILLVAEGFHHDIPKGYIYFAMFFSLAIDLLQMRMNNKGHKNIPGDKERPSLPDPQ
jgi:predicted tellurium resistance membrane protein TerC